MKPERGYDIASEISATESLESASAVGDLPSTLVRDVTLFDEQNHTDTTVHVVVVVDVDIDEDILSAVDVDIDVDIDVDTHTDTN